jgi:hypothetical protein
MFLVINVYWKLNHHLSYGCLIPNVSATNTGTCTLDIHYWDNSTRTPL